MLHYYMFVGMGGILPTMGGWIIIHHTRMRKDSYKYIILPCPKINQVTIINPNKFTFKIMIHASKYN